MFKNTKTSYVLVFVMLLYMLLNDKSCHFTGIMIISFN